MKHSIAMSSSLSTSSTLALSVMLCLVTLLPGCATDSALLMQQVDQQTSDQQLVQKVMEALQTTEARIARAQAENVAMYAPRQMDQAKSALSEARRYYERFQADPQNVNKSISLFFSDTMGEKALALIAEADMALTEAEANKRQADSIFAEWNENLIWLTRFQAPAQFPDEFEDLERAQRRLVNYVAEGRQDAAREGLPRLLQEQRALETAAAQRFYLFDISQRIERQGQYNVDRFAPLSYSAALGALNNARAVIAQNSRDEAGILAARASAEFSFDVALAVAADMMKLVEMDRRDMERWLILVETKLYEVGNSIGARDVRDHELVQQLNLMAAAAKLHNEQVAQNSGQAKQKPEPGVVAESAPAAAATNDAVANAVEVPEKSEAINARVDQLEQSLSEQVTALSEQLNAMKAANQSAQATPVYAAPVPGAQYDKTYAPAAPRSSLFGN